MRSLVPTILIAVSCAGTGRSANLIDQQPVSQTAQLSTPTRPAYDDFRLDKSAQLDHLTWWGTSSQAANDFTIKILGTRNGNEPDPTNVLFQETQKIAGIYQPVGYGETRFDFIFEDPLLVAGNTDYYLSVAATGWNWLASYGQASDGAIDRDCVAAGYQACHLATNKNGNLIASSYNLAWQLQGSVSAAPEPTTWALIIMGVGIAGGALRRQRAAARVGYAA